MNGLSLRQLNISPCRVVARSPQSAPPDLRAPDPRAGFIACCCSCLLERTTEAQCRVIFALLPWTHERPYTAAIHMQSRSAPARRRLSKCYAEFGYVVSSRVESGRIARLLRFHTSFAEFRFLSYSVPVRSYASYAYARRRAGMRCLLCRSGPQCANPP